MKALLYILGVIVAIALGYWLFNGYIYNEKQPSERDQADADAANLVLYFEIQVTEQAIADIGQPIEGFDAELLILAYPGLQAGDFAGVETREGFYEVIEGALVFERYEEQPVSTAERTVSAAGYQTLLDNVAARLEVPLETETDVDTIIELINTRESRIVSLGQTTSAFGVMITPREVREDSRCPEGVQCIQAGTVRVVATVESGLETTDEVFVLGESVGVGPMTLTLTQVEPAPSEEAEIQPSTYRFTFEVEKG